MRHRRSFSASLSVATLVAAAAHAQQLQWRKLVPNAIAECQLVFDTARHRFVAVANDTLEWDGTDWRLRQTEHAPPVRRGFGLAFDRARNVTVLFGGTDGQTKRNDLWEYDGIDWVARTPTTGPSPRSAAAMAWTPLLGTVVFGGAGNASLLGDTWTWDGTAWLQLPGTGPAPRSQAAMAYHNGTASLVLFGGDRGSDETWILQGLQWLRQQPTTVPTPRLGHRLCGDDFHAVVRMFGTEDTNLWQWDGFDWSIDSSSPEPRVTFGLAADDQGTTMVFGGTQQLRVPSLPIVMQRQCSDTWLRDQNGWQKVRSAPPALTDANLAYDVARDRVVLHGSPGDNMFLQPTREWDGAHWHEFPGSQLPWVFGAKMTYDLLRARTVRFGGLSQGGATFFAVTNDLREWDGASWTQNAQPGPSARYAHGMVFDPGRGAVLLFGGSNISGMLNDLWAWDGVLWTQIPGTAPPGRMMHTMAFDLNRGRAVVFGGVGQAGVLGDTWEWDGAQWLQRTGGPQPPARKLAICDYDQARQRTVMFSGSNAAGTLLTDVWEWDGAQWSGGTTPLPQIVANSVAQAVALGGSRWFAMTAAGVFAGSGTPAASADLGGGCASSNAPALVAFGDPVVGRPEFTLELHRGTAGAPFLIALSIGSIASPLPGGCTLHLANLDLPMFGLMPQQGPHVLPLAVPGIAGIQGLQVAAQAAQLDPAMPLGIALSNAQLLTIGL